MKQWLLSQVAGRIVDVRCKWKCKCEQNVWQRFHMSLGGLSEQISRFRLWDYNPMSSLAHSSDIGK